MTLANILRTDADQHRRVAGGHRTGPQSIAVLARAHQDATWRRTRAGNELRSLLREYLPGFLPPSPVAAPANLASADARAVLAIAPTPATAAKLTKPGSSPRCGGAAASAALDQARRTAPTAPTATAAAPDPMVEEAMGAQALRLLATLDTECDSVDQLGEAVAAAFTTHPDHQIITSLHRAGRPHRRPACSPRSATTEHDSPTRDR